MKLYSQGLPLTPVAVGWVEVGLGVGVGVGLVLNREISNGVTKLTYLSLRYGGHIAAALWVASASCGDFQKALLFGSLWPGNENPQETAHGIEYQAVDQHPNQCRPFKCLVQMKR